MKRLSQLLVSFLVLTGCRTTKHLPTTPITNPSIQSLSDMKSIRVGDADMAFHESGTGKETLLLVHGLGSNSSFWKANIAALAARYHVVAVDLPGYGASSKANVPGTMDYFATQLAGFLDALKLKQVHYAGVSMGGQIGMTFALKYPERLKSLVLVSPAGIETFSDQEKQVLRNFMTTKSVMEANLQQVTTSVALNFAHWDPAQYGWLVDQRMNWQTRSDFEGYAAANEKSVSGMLDGPVYDRLGALKMPILVLYGADDKMIPNRFLHPKQTTAMVADAAQRAMPHATIKLIPNAGHILMLEQPQAFQETVLDWLGKLK